MTPKPSFLLLFFSSCFLGTVVVARNIVADPTRDVTIVARQGSSPLISRREPNGSISRTRGLSDSYDDVAFDAVNDLLIAISFSDRRVTSFSVRRNGSLVRIDSRTAAFQTSPFCRISAMGGTLVISGGTGGFTVWRYGPGGTFEAQPSTLNAQPLGIGHPGANLITPDVVALSTDLNLRDFGVIILDVDTLQRMRTVPVVNGLGSRNFELEAGSANFPIENCMYADEGSGTTFMYTANGAVQVSRPLEGATVVNDDIGANGLAVACAVDQASGTLAVGALVDGGGTGGRPSRIEIYDLVSGGDPANPVRVKRMRVPGIVTSVALVRDGNRVVFVNSAGRVRSRSAQSSRPRQQNVFQNLRH